MIKLIVSKGVNIAIGGMLATMVVLSGCDRPRDEPTTPRPEPPPQQKISEDNPGKARNQEEYADEIIEPLTDRTSAYL